MSTFNTVVAAARAALDQMTDETGGGLDLTGKVWFDTNSEAVWFQVEDDRHHVTNWISLDFPEYAAHGETIVVAADENDMHHFDENRQPPVTYSVMCNEIDDELRTEEVLYSGLTRAEATATVESARDMGEPEKFNYYIRKDPRP
jgi:hypothetical protein